MSLQVVLDTLSVTGVLTIIVKVTAMNIALSLSLSLPQVFNFAFFFTAAIYLFLPSFWITIFIVVYEGLLGGGVYVNAFYAISREVLIIF